MSFALLVIDVQGGLFDPQPGPFEGDAVINRINRITAMARAAGVPVVYVQHEQEETVLEYGSSGWQLQAGLNVGKNDFFVRKTTPDSFHGTNLQQVLADHSVDTLVICGYASEFCVDTTVRRAAALGFSVLIAADAHTTHDKAHLKAERIREHHNRTLSNIKSFGPEIRVLSTEDIAFC